MVCDIFFHELQFTAFERFSFLVFEGASCLFGILVIADFLYAVGCGLYEEAASVLRTMISSTLPPLHFGHSTRHSRASFGFQSRDHPSLMFS